MKRALLGVLLCGFGAPPVATADGLPVTGLDGSAGVVTRDGAYRIVTFVSGNHTVLARLHVNGSTVARFRTISGQYSIPIVAYDSSAGGLSADGHTLALIRPRVQIPQERTHLMLLDANRFLSRRTIVLNGDFSFDAISPDGSKVYLVNYLSLSRRNFDPTKYTVRSLDAATGKLDPAPVVDPRELDEKMGGMPVTRAMSPDGRWAYTLYSGSKAPFLHALDTVGHTARCIDLDALAKRDDIFQMKLRVAAGGGRIDVSTPAKPVLSIDTTSFKVSAAHVAAPGAHVAAVAHDDGPAVWPYALGAAVLLLLIAAASAKPLARATRAR